MKADSLPQTLVEIARKIEAQERLSFEDGMTLFESDDLLAVGLLANSVRAGLTLPQAMEILVKEMKLKE